MGEGVARGRAGYCRGTFEGWLFNVALTRFRGESATEQITHAFINEDLCGRSIIVKSGRTGREFYIKSSELMPDNFYFY